MNVYGGLNYSDSLSINAVRRHIKASRLFHYRYRRAVTKSFVCRFTKLARHNPSIYVTLFY